MAQIKQSQGKHESVVCNMRNGARYDDGRGGHCCPLHTAAPELLEALQELLRVDDDWHGAVNSKMSHARNMARAAIAKATA